MLLAASWLKGRKVCRQEHISRHPTTRYWTNERYRLLLLFYYATNAAHKKHTITMSKKTSASV